MIEALNRCAIGIRLPEAAITAIGEAQVQMRRRAGADLIRWTPGNELLLPLAMLGEITPEHIVRVHRLLEPIGKRHAPVSVTLDGVGGSPTVLQPRWLWVSVGGDIPQLERLQADIETAVTPLLPDHESRGFRAQIPVGRLKQESEANRTALGRAIRMAAIGALGGFTISEFELMRYHATTTGPILQPLEKYLLKG